MASKSEAGIARIIGNYETLQEKIRTFSGRYNPVNPLITFDNLANKYQQAKKAMDDTGSRTTLGRLR